MNDLLPIVPGCLCLVIKSVAGNEGRVVTVIERTPTPSGFRGEARDWWRTKENMLWTLGPPSPFAYEAQLMRIDGHQPDEQDETEKEKECEH